MNFLAGRYPILSCLIGRILLFSFDLRVVLGIEEGVEARGECGIGLYSRCTNKKKHKWWSNNFLPTNREEYGESFLRVSDVDWIEWMEVVSKNLLKKVVLVHCIFPRNCVVELGKYFSKMIS